MAGSTVTEPSIATNTTTMAARPRPWNVAMPDSSMPTIPVITIRPETSTERPEVAAATCSALARSRPAARS